MEMPETGLAFPVVREQVISVGMTLRDYFAAKAMQGSLAAPLESGVATGPGCWDAIAKDSYKMADAMLKARKQ